MRLSHTNIIVVLRQTREILGSPENAFVWSSWENAEAGQREIDGLIARIEAGELPERSALELLFLPTGPIQDVGLSSGWRPDFLSLADG